MVYLKHMPHGGVVQLREYLVCNQKVSGSTPLISIVFNEGTQSPDVLLLRQQHEGAHLLSLVVDFPDFEASHR